MSLNLKPEDITPQSVEKFLKSIDTDALLKNIDVMLTEAERKGKSNESRD